jgi:hypothetical protein
MKIFIFPILLLLTKFSFAQNLNKDISFIVEEYSDTVMSGKSSFLILNLQNKSNFPILISNHENIYYKAIKIGKKDTTSTEKFLANGNPHYMTGERTEILMPRQFKKYELSLFYGIFDEIGLFKVKFYFELKKLNSCNPDAESAWTNFYIKKANYNKGKYIGE